LWSRVRTFLGLPRARRALALEAALALAGFRLLLALAPFRWIAGRLGRAGADLPEPAGPDPLAAEVAWALGAAGRRLPWTSSCLVRALAGGWLLTRRGVPALLVFGLAPSGKTGFDAHAWLCSGGWPVAGGEVARGYRVIARFVLAPRPKGGRR